MGRLIVKLEDEMADGVELYMEWSTVVDAPVSPLLSLEDFREWHNWRHPNIDISERLERVAEKGTSSLDGTTPEELLAFNRAGEGESHLTKGEIIAQYREDGN